MKQKTIDYLNTSANKLEELFSRAVEYRAKFNVAESSVAKEMYGKKLKKIIKQMDPYISLFNDMQSLKQMKEDEQSKEIKVEE